MRVIGQVSLNRLLSERGGIVDMRERVGIGLSKARLTVFVTSRLETPIRNAFRIMENIIHRDLVLQNVTRCITDRDIALYPSGTGNSRHPGR